MNFSAAAPLAPIPERIQKMKLMGVDNNKKRHVMKSILGNVQSNVRTPLYLQKVGTLEEVLIQKSGSAREMEENLEGEKEELIEKEEINFPDQTSAGKAAVERCDQNEEKKEIEEKREKQEDNEEERKIQEIRQRTEEHSLLLEYNGQKLLHAAAGKLSFLHEIFMIYYSPRIRAIHICA